jgi:hypothetical protein
MAAGHHVTGWNRSREKATPLIAAGKIVSMMALQCESERPRNHDRLVNTKLRRSGR